MYSFKNGCFALTPKDLLLHLGEAKYPQSLASAFLLNAAVPTLSSERLIKTCL